MSLEKGSKNLLRSILMRGYFRLTQIFITQYHWLILKCNSMPFEKGSKNLLQSILMRGDLYFNKYLKSIRHTIPSAHTKMYFHAPRKGISKLLMKMLQSFLMRGCFRLKQILQKSSSHNNTCSY